MDYKLKMDVRYFYANPHKSTMWLAEVLNAYETVREMRLEAWIECDKHYDALRVFQITKLEFEKNGRVKLIQMTEGKYGQ